MTSDPYLPPGCTQSMIDAYLEDEGDEAEGPYCHDCGWPVHACECPEPDDCSKAPPDHERLVIPEDDIPF